MLGHYVPTLLVRFVTTWTADNSDFGKASTKSKSNKIVFKIVYKMNHIYEQYISNIYNSNEI